MWSGHGDVFVINSHSYSQVLGSVQVVFSAESGPTNCTVSCHPLTSYCDITLECVESYAEPNQSINQSKY